jgi:hypothetical protein
MERITDTNATAVFGPPPSEMGPAQSEHADQSDDDEVNRDDEVEQARHDQDQNACYQRNQRSEAQMDIHGDSLLIFLWEWVCIMHPSGDW